MLVDCSEGGECICHCAFDAEQSFLREQHERKHPDESVAREKAGAVPAESVRCSENQQFRNKKTSDFIVRWCSLSKFQYI